MFRENWKIWYFKKVTAASIIWNPYILFNSGWQYFSQSRYKFTILTKYEFEIQSFFILLISNYLLICLSLYKLKIIKKPNILYRVWQINTLFVFSNANQFLSHWVKKNSIIFHFENIYVLTNTHCNIIKNEIFNENTLWNLRHLIIKMPPFTYILFLL